MKKDTKKWVSAGDKLAIYDYMDDRGDFNDLARLYNVSHVTVMNCYFTLAIIPSLRDIYGNITWRK